MAQKMMLSEICSCNCSGSYLRRGLARSATLRLPSICVTPAPTNEIRIKLIQFWTSSFKSGHPLPNLARIRPLRSNLARLWARISGRIWRTSVQIRQTGRIRAKLAQAQTSFGANRHFVWQNLANDFESRTSATRAIFEQLLNVCSARVNPRRSRQVRPNNLQRCVGTRFPLRNQSAGKHPRP